MVTQCLHEIGLDGFLHECSHRTLGIQFRGIDRSSVKSVSDVNLGKALLEVFQTLAQAQNRHHFAGSGDIESGFPRDSARFSSQADNDISQGAVIHVHRPLPEYRPGIDAKVSGFALNIVINQC